MIREISFNGKCLTDFGVLADFSDVFNTPAYEVSTVSIPGRSGDLIIPENRFENRRLKMKCFIRENFVQNYRDLVNYLASLAGRYERLEITAEPDVYMNAAFYSALVPDTGQFLRWGRFDLVFDCMPQKYLKLGEQKIDYGEASVNTLMNLTQHRSRPLITVEPTSSNATITINDQTISVTANNFRFYIDCELMHAYRINTSQEAISMDSYVSMPDSFVELMPGQNRIMTVNAAISLTPRWWRL